MLSVVRLRPHGVREGGRQSRLGSYVCRYQIERWQEIKRLVFQPEKFAGDQLRVKLRMLKRIEPVISRKYLLSWPELAGLSILRCARGTNFRVTHEQAAALQKVVEGFQSFPNGNGSGEKRVVFAQG